MQVIVKSKNVELDEKLKLYVGNKMLKLRKYLSQPMKAYVEFAEEKTLKQTGKNKHVDITVVVAGKVMRSEATTGSFISSVDESVKKLERQLRAYKEKMVQHRRGSLKTLFEGLFPKKPDAQRKLMKIKKFPMKPQTPQEAIQEMNNLGHSFFVFLNVDTENINVVYQRKDGNYGVIEPLF